MANERNTLGDVTSHKIKFVIYNISYLFNVYVSESSSLLLIALQLNKNLQTLIFFFPKSTQNTFQNVPN